MPNNSSASPYILLDQSSPAVEVNTQTTPRNASAAIAPPRQYLSGIVIPHASSRESKSHNTQIENENKILDGLMKSISQSIKKIHNNKIRLLLTDTFLNDVDRIPQLKEAISENIYEALCSKECCCVLCGVTLSIAAVSAAVGTISTLAGGLFGSSLWNASHVLTGLEYGAIVGGATGGCISLVLYLNEFLNIIQLARTTPAAEEIKKRVDKLQQQFQAQSNQSIGAPRTPTPLSGMHEVSLS